MHCKLERSCLYSIEPIGVGTINVESLSSYISRLADAHCVTVGDIMTHLIATKIDKKYINNLVFKGGNGFYKSSSAINGHGNIADNFIEVIAFLTKRRDIGKTTFVNCREIVPFRGLLKSSRHWCPSCFQADLESKQIVYERLSWNLQPFHKCIIHDRTLESVCPFCKSSMYTLERKSVTGYCSKCFYWLGNFEESRNITINDGETNDDSMRTFFSALINLSFENDCVSRSISFYLERNFEGSLTKTAGFFGYPKSTLWGWKEGTNLPPLNALIKITMKLQISLAEFFNMEKSKITLKNDCFDRIVSSGRVKKDHKKIQDFLKLIIAEKRPYSLSEIANLMECDRKLLTQMYPNECQQIKVNYLDNLEMKKQFKNDAMKKSIDNAVYTLMKRGTYPSSGKVEEIIGKGKLHEKKYQDYWREKKSSLTK
ncbi:TniQ family protein [Lysinibacillus xylanilyticus]|uniref:TniQ family protein n=1 Tax=Lysinibacillus xylanilyticus TaxID=582475 RepID=UPI00382A684B